MTAEIAAYWPQVLKMLTAAGGALLVFVGFWIAGGIARAVIARVAERDKARRDVLELLGNAARWGIVGFGAVTALGTLGADVTGLIAGLGLTGFALGFALKDIVSSLMAGLLILLNRPFVSGDRVIVTGIEGLVAKIDLRYTEVVSDDGKRHLIPNANVLGNVVTVLPAQTAA
ncbi:mechanosensitive ion channel domain-containing protein [Ferrovibrio sp.]|uniref:mechanosensitive ion channel family protein n=1 Tax=Ferrovibrio sp. TaxID=1917215 RepID=UPI001B681333|nr:mechanosensitive ion channel domain-containing protein [Ferrovibrio sp.]MBP7065798.1 mechanosensitive ion channel [Ferrovibrio sp.]